MKNQEGIRREQFCQFVKEITGSRDYLVVGIDVAKSTHHAFMGTATGVSLLRKLIFENNIEGFSRLLTTSQEIQTKNGLSKIVYGLEPTGNYHKPLAGHLIGCGCNVVMVTGSAIKKNRELLDGRWDKNDTKDAANAADLTSRGRCVYLNWPTQEMNDLRSLLSLRRRLKKEEHGLKMRIRNTVLAHYFPELDSFYTACESETLAIVKYCCNPDLIATLEFDEFFKLVTRSRRGIAQKLRLLKIHRAAIDSVGCPMGGAAESEAELLVEKLENVRDELRDVTDLMEELCLTFPEYSYLLTIPGFGPYVSAVVLAAIGDPNRFDNRKQVIKLSGYDLNANRSGKTSAQSVPVISKRGNSQLRFALFQAAKVSSSRVDYMKDYFAKMLSGRERERGIITKMRVKLAAKLLVIAWTLMKNKESFDPKYLK